MWLADMFTGRKQDRFIELLCQHAAILVQAADALERYVAQGKPELSDEVDTLEKRGDEILLTMLTALTETFITPFDRQDIYALGEAIDDMIDYINNAAREIKIFGVSATPAMEQMAGILSQGAREIRDAVAAIESQPDVATHCARAACSSENAMENLYRRTLAELFDSNDVPKIFKLREIYRHFSNSADRADSAGRLLGKIVVKVA
jgi:predicted phosphate transport protein (TIGR00153 family)